MSIIYSYPEQAPLNLNDMLIGTSSVKVGGKQKNITRNFSLKQIADFIGEGGAVFNPTASDFQIGVFNQGGTKLTGSIMSQDAFPGGTGITVAGNLTATNNLTASGDIVLGNPFLTNNIKLLSETYLSGQIRDAVGNIGADNQILVSSYNGYLQWSNYNAGLAYQGTWDGTTGRTSPGYELLIPGIGVNSEFYIVTVAGNYQLDGNPASPESPPYWQIGDWVIFVSKGNTNEWQKIDNTSALTGTGTDNKIAMWTGGATPSVTLADSMISQDAGATAVTITGTVIPTTITDKDTEVGTAGQILSSTVTGIEWIDNQVGTVTGTGVTNTLPIWSNGPSGILGNSILDQVAAAGVFTDTHLSIQGSGGLSTQNLEINKALYDGNAAPGADGQVLTSSTQGADQEVRWVNASTVGDTYTIQSTSTPGVNRVPIDLTAASGAAASSVLNLVEGTGITLAQTSATEITISGSAQGVTGSGTSGKLPKFDTATSLDDSIVTQTEGTTTIIPLNDGPSLPASIQFSPQTSQFSMPNYATYNTVTGPAPQVGDVFNFVLTSDLVWAVGGGVIPAGTYPFTITFVSSGLSCSFNSYTIPASASGLGYTNLLGNGSSTGVNTAVDALSIDGELSMATHKIINVVNPTDAQDAATKAYVDASSSDTTYTLAAGAKTSSSVPLNLSPSTGSDTTVNLTEGTGITLTQTSATEITIEGTAQGVTGSGTVNKLPKFGTTTSLTDSLVSEVPASSSSSYTADNTFFVEPVPQFLIMSGIRRLRWLRSQDINAFPTLTFPPNTATGTGVLVLTGDIILDADSTDVITAGTYNVDVIVGVSGGVWNAIELYFSAADWLQPTGVTGNVSYANSGAVTSLVLTTAATLAEIEIAAQLDMTSNKVLNVLDPVNPQDAATKAYVDTTAAGSGALVYQTGYNAITNVPDLTTGGTGVLQGFTYAVTAGPSTTFWNPPLDTGDLLIANVDNPTTIADWTEIQSNIGIAGSGATDAVTIKGVSGFNSDDFDVSVNGWVQAKDFTGNTPGYVPDATSATAGTFLKEDGTWSAIAPTAGVGSYTTGNGTILSPQTTSVQLAISPNTISGSVFTFVNGLSIGDLVQITDGTVNGFFTYSIAGGGPNGYRFAYVSGEIPTNFSTNANVINLRNASAGVIGDISGSGNGSSVTYFTGIIGDTGVKEITSNPNIVIDSTGRFGIGTDQPSHDLDVRNVISPPIINLQDANLNSCLLYTSDAADE